MLVLFLSVAKSLLKQFLLKVILSWMISLNLLGAVFIGSGKRGGAVTISVCFLLANAVFWCFFKLLSCPFSIWNWWQPKSLHTGKVSDRECWLLPICFHYLPP